MNGHYVITEGLFGGNDSGSDSEYVPKEDKVNEVCVGKKKIVESKTLYRPDVILKSSFRNINFVIKSYFSNFFPK
jgi:hypothetical protein